ncbi:MAG: 6-phosphofructokinase [Oscillospiraceae bacterium]|nr:6-phosphofructokinase [Oscillospiraceae bacterium]
MSAVKRIGVLTSGGDAPGMNAAIRAVTRMSIKLGHEVYGIYRGFNGLINGDIKQIGKRMVSGIIQRGGTILYTARCPEFKEEEGLQKAKQQCIEHGIDGIVVIGGDGSFRGARDLSERGIPCIAIPGTIDNDIACTDYSIGFDTAINTVAQMVDKLRDTTQSHNRCSIIEVMGRRAGYIALQAGISCGAEYIIVPEGKLNIKEVIKKIQSTLEHGKQHFIIMITEGIGDVHTMARMIEEFGGVEARTTILGHVQRGGNPTVKDRVAASQLGYHAACLIDKGIGNRVVGFDRGEIVDHDIAEALEMKREFSNDLYDIAHEISF